MRTSNSKELPFSLPSGTPYVKKLDLSAATSYATKAVVVGGVTYTEGTDFNAGGLDVLDRDYGLLIANTINGYTTDRSVGNPDAYAGVDGSTVWLYGRVPGKNFTCTTTITGAVITTEATGLSSTTQDIVVIDQVLTVDTGAYTANDCVGGKLTFAAALPESNGKMVLQDIFIRDFGNQKAATLTNNAAVVLSTNKNDVIGVFSIAASDYITITQAASSPAYGSVRNIGKVVLGADSSTSLYGLLQTTGTPTYVATTDLELVLCLTPL
jgi:hypothetical protein